LIIKLGSSVRDDVFWESMFAIDGSLENSGEFLYTPVLLPGFKDGSFGLLVSDDEYSII